jgi:AraC-like DNA-binding protein
MALQAVQTARFSDVDELAAALPGGAVTATPLRPLGCLVETTTLRLHDVVLQFRRSSPLMGFGSVASDAAWIVLPLDGLETLVLNGRAAQGAAVAVHGPGAGYDWANTRETSWSLLTLPAASVDRLLAPPRRSPIRCRGASAVLRTDPVAWARTVSLLRAASEVLAADPDVFEVEEARRSLRASVLDAVHELLAGRWDGLPPRALRASPTRQRILRAVDDYLRSDPRLPADTADLSAALGLSPSRLRAAVTASFGTSPQRYVMLRRLTMARAALRMGDPRWFSVRQVGLAHGFQRAASFARAYRDLFGETPEATFARATGRADADDSRQRETADVMQ